MARASQTMHCQPPHPYCLVARYSSAGVVIFQQSRFEFSDNYRIGKVFIEIFTLGVTILVTPTAIPNMKQLKYVVCLWGLFICLAARAELTIEISVQGAKQIPIAILPFAGQNPNQQSISKIVAADLARTGLFKLVDPAGLQPDLKLPQNVAFSDWRGRGADAMVIGTVEPGASGKLQVRFHLLDVTKQAQLTSLDYSIVAAQIRPTAHKIADVIYEKLLGEPGAFNTKITYVVKQASSFLLKVADADGYNEQTVLASTEPIISPSWSPDGTRIAYVSFEQKKPIVMVQSLATGARNIIASFRGNNSSPAWSPDGKTLAVTLTKDGGSQLYLINADGGTPTRLSSSNGIDTEPAFSPDGKYIVFTSDRGGSPQVYRTSASGGEVQRMTFSGTYNVSPHYSPDGKNLIYIQRNGGQYRVVMQELETGQIQILTDTSLDESPSFAPNGRTILYATNVKGRGLLATVSNDGRIKQRLSSQAGDIREPSWGPMLK
jgi:TolB protein